MARVKRELRTEIIAAKIPLSVCDIMVNECERLNITVSEYVNRILRKELKIKNPK